MPDPVHLQLFPSCYNCLSWSADGELAVAAGEYVHVLTPKSHSLSHSHSNQEYEKERGRWHITRLRANIFTSTEWPTLHPQDRSAFSIGAEQSLSTVVGVSWSPPGLARHRRCVLGVLTSNLVLSFYESVGRPQHGKWRRVAVVNAALAACLDSLWSELGEREGEGKTLRKTMVRSFAWCEPLKVPVDAAGTGAYFVPDGVCRWGVQVLQVTNDDNDLVFLRVQESTPFSFEVLAVTSLRDVEDNDAGSLFSNAVKTRIKTLSVACGPWIPLADTRPGVYSVTSNVAVAHGKTLKTVKLDVELTTHDGYRTVAKSEENSAISKHIQNCGNVTGPFQWIHTDDGVLLAIGAFTELITISIPISAYLGKSTKSKIQKRQWPFYEGTETRHWEPISGIASDRDGTLYLSTNGGYGAAKSIHDLDDTTLSQAPWKDSFDSYCEQFDIDRDLGGMVTGRIWGLACHNGVLAVAFTMHPKDMVEYRTAAEERTIITFTQLYPDTREQPADLSADLSAEALRTKRETVIGYILHSEQLPDGRSQLSKKAIYAAACCAILDCQNEELLARSRTSLEWLASVTGADLSKEISKCTPASGTIESKSSSELSGPGTEIFERCEICDAGVRWYSVTEAQCANGHLFVRCGLTFLAIQEPGISKFCADCGTEYLGGDFVNVSRGSDLCTTYQVLCDAFDLCIYCGGKFQP